MTDRRWEFLRSPQFWISNVMLICFIVGGMLQVRDDMREMKATVASQGTVLASVSSDVRKISDQTIAITKDQERSKERLEEIAVSTRENTAYINVLNKDVAAIKGKINLR